MRKLYLAALMGATALTPGLAVAQSASGVEVQEVVITAQRREMKVETAPMSVAVVDGAVVAEQGLREIKDLKASVPGLTLHETPGGLAGVSIRGIGTSAGSQLFEQSVGLFVDGVYHPRSRQFRDGLFDVERIEVVKGSQGVLFGKNTSVGAISVISAQPASTFSGYAQGEYESEYGSTNIQGAVNVPVTDTFRFRIAAMHDEQAGFVRNVYLQRDEGEETRDLIRGVFSWDVTPNFNATLKLQHGEYDAVGNTFQYISTTNPTALRTALRLGADVNPVEPYVKSESSFAADGRPYGDQIDTQTSDDHALTLRYELPSGHVITAITGYSKFNFTYGFDSDSTPNATIFSQFNEAYKQTTQEIRVMSPTGGPVDYIAGAFYLNATSDYDYRGYYRGFFGVLNGLQSQLFKQDEDAYAVFGELTWHITPTLDLDVGARYSDDQKDATYTRILRDNFGYPSTVLPLGILASRIGDVNGSPKAATPPWSDTVEDKTTDYSVTLSYKLSDRSTVYASVGRGNKGAGFLNQAGSTEPHPTPFYIPKEVADTIEVGIKGRFLDGRAYASVALYQLDIKNYQDSFYNSTIAAFQVRSMDAKTRGGELEARFQATSWLSFYGNASYNPTAELTNGERMQRSPKFTGMIGSRVETSLSETLDFTGSLELVHSDSFLHQPASAPGNNTSGSYDLVSARLQLTYKPMDVQVFVAASNLTDDRYRTFAFGSPTGLGFVGAYNQPRTIRFGLRKAF